MTPDQFQSQSEAWISAAEHVAVAAGSALLTLAAAGYGAWLKWGPKIKAGYALIQSCKTRLDLHDAKSGFDSAAAAAIPAPAKEP